MGRTLSWCVFVYQHEIHPSGVVCSPYSSYRESKPYAWNKAEWWPHFSSYASNPNNKESASQGHRCSGNLLQIWQKEDVRNVAQSFQMAQRLVLTVDALLSNKQKQRHKICRIYNRMIPIKRFQNYFGRANFIKSFVVANLTWHNASMKLGHYGGKLLQCGGNALLRNSQHSVAAQQEENSFPAL